jgi:hypothetical protein
MGFLVHIGFFIISPYPLYSVCSLCLLQEATFLLACRILALTSLVSAQRNPDRYNPKHVEVCGLCCNLPQWGKANRLFRSLFFSHFLFHPHHSHSEIPPFHSWRFLFQGLFKAAQFLRQQIRKNFIIWRIAHCRLLLKIYRVSSPFQIGVISQNPIALRSFRRIKIKPRLSHSLRHTLFLVVTT